MPLSALLSLTIDFVTKLVGPVAKWLVPFFIGKQLEQKKGLERALDNLESRAETHRDVVTSSDNRTGRNKLREWAKPD